MDLPSLVVSILLVAGCTSSGRPADPAGPTGSDDSADPVEPAPFDGHRTSGRDTRASVDDTAGGPHPVVTEETVEDQDLDDSWIFSEETIHGIEIEISADSRTSLDADPYTFVPAAVTFDGERLEEVGLRLRGQIGSFRTLTGKPKFKIDFNEYVPDQRFWGLEALALNNEVVDCSYIKEPISYRVFRAAGIPAPRTGFAMVTVNDASYGLYVIVEVPDDRFLRRVYEFPDGNLYDGKYVWYGGWSYTLLDFAAGVDHLYELEEGVDVAHTDITGVSHMLNTSAGRPDFYARMDEVIDWEEFHREQLGEQWAGQEDGYGMNQNNYRVYFDPADDRVEFIPWDLDYSFLEDYAWGFSWAAPSGNIASSCMVDATCYAAQRDLVTDVLDAIEADDLPGRVEDMIALIASDVAIDPRRECSIHSVVYYQNLVRSWVATRSDYMRSFWGVP